MENQNVTSSTNETTEEVKDFITKGFFPLIKKVLLNPTDLSSELHTTNTTTKSIVMIAICGILFTILPYIFVGSLREFAGFRPFIQVGLLSMMVLILIIVFTYLLKLTKIKTAKFKDALLVGGLCAVPLIISLAIYCVVSIFSGNIFAGGIAVIMNGGWFLLLVNIYCMLVMINIVYQSLCSIGFKANAAWYLSPLAVLAAFFFAFKIAFWLL